MLEDGAIVETWRQFKGTRNRAALDRLVRHYMPLVEDLAHRRAARLPKSVDPGDLIQAGTLGLLDAIDSYDLDRQISFKTFSGRRILGAMVDESRVMDWLPRQVRSRARVLELARTQLLAGLGRAPTEMELRERSGLSPRDFSNLTRHLRAAMTRSIGRQERTDSGDEPSCLPADDRIPDPSVAAQRQSLKDVIVQGLSRAERLIVTLYYYENLSMREIGEVLDLSESRVSQLHTSIVSRLKAKIDLTSARALELSAAA
jgi:RNA polymerase sigma factor for flagellar operon FliA